MRRLVELVEDICSIDSLIEKQLVECFSNSQEISNLARIIQETFSKLGKFLQISQISDAKSLLVIRNKGCYAAVGRSYWPFQESTNSLSALMLMRRM